MNASALVEAHWFILTWSQVRIPPGTELYFLNVVLRNFSSPWSLEESLKLVCLRQFKKFASVRCFDNFQFWLGGLIFIDHCWNFVENFWLVHLKKRFSTKEIKIWSLKKWWESLNASTSSSTRDPFHARNRKFLIILETLVCRVSARFETQMRREEEAWRERLRADTPHKKLRQDCWACKEEDNICRLILEMNLIWNGVSILNYGLTQRSRFAARSLYFWLPCFLNVRSLVMRNNLEGKLKELKSQIKISNENFSHRDLIEFVMML